MHNTTKTLLLGVCACVVVLWGQQVYKNHNTITQPEWSFADLRKKQTSTSCEDTTPVFSTQWYKPSSASSEAFRLCVSAFGARQTPCGDPNNEMTRRYGQKAMVQKLNQELKNDTSATNAYIKQMAAKYAASSMPGGVGQWVDHPDVGIIDCLETNSAMKQEVTTINFQEEQCGYRCIYDNVVRLWLEWGTPAWSMWSPLPDDDILRPWRAHSAFADFMAEKHKKVTINDQDRYNPAYHAEYKTWRQQEWLFVPYQANTSASAPTFAPSQEKPASSWRLPTTTPQRVTDPSIRKDSAVITPQAGAIRDSDSDSNILSPEEMKKMEQKQEDQTISAYRYSLAPTTTKTNDDSDTIQTAPAPTTRTLRY